FGRKSLNEIKEILAAMGLGLGMKFDEQGRIIQEPEDDGADDLGDVDEEEEE
ncbi:MAG TPA: DNA-directed RNA polymerase subunit alpha, partial [Blastocatellia bacterium]|nr:DNA-directed RNA polymerase subunit alpha [Blastocatellia bacterium]